MKKITFIINPIAGGRNKTALPQLIQQHLDFQQYEPQIVYTAYAGHGKILAKEAVNRKVAIVVAVGGDGSVNDIASALVHTSTTLAIIPMGSGNGLAEKLSIPKKIVDAIKLINQAHQKAIDVLQVNDLYAFSVAGYGFGAAVSHHFASTHKRGFFEYLRVGIYEAWYNVPQTYTISCNGKTTKVYADMLDFSNSGWYGYDIAIHPEMLIDDGLFDVSVVKHFPLWKSAYMFILLAMGRISSSKYYLGISTNQAVVTTDIALKTQIDGEAGPIVKKVTVTLHHLALQILVNPCTKAISQ